MMSHFATSSWGGVRKFPRVFTQEDVVAICDRFNSMKHSTVLPYAFTEQGILGFGVRSSRKDPHS